MLPGLGNMDPKKMQKIMKKLNMDVEEVEASKVTINCADKDIIIDKPEIMIVNMSGREVYQITGEISEAVQMSEEDIKMIMDQTGKTRETVVETLERLNNDLAAAIKELKD